MSFLDTVAKAKAYLEEHGRVSLRGLLREFEITPDILDDLVDELVTVQQVAQREGDVLVAVDADPAPTAPAEPAAAPPQASASAAERRPLTVMFIDLVGSTALSERVDPEDLASILEAYQTQCREVLGRWGGFVARPLGDGLLTYFGYPQAQEDAPARAVYAGLEIAESMPALSQTLEMRHPLLTDRPLQIRVGIHTGLVVVGDIANAGTPEQVAIGETPNIAARLQGMAGANEVVLSDPTLQLIPGMFFTEDLGPVELKGIAEPLRIHRAISGTGVRSRSQKEPSTAVSLVGREEELAILTNRWQRAREGEGQVTLISGEAGVGKTRIIRGFRTRLRGTGHRWLEAHCDPYATQSAFAPWIKLLEEKIGRYRDDSDDVTLKRLEESLAADGVDLSENLPYLAALLSLSGTEERYPRKPETPQKARQHTLDTFVTWLEKQSEVEPTVLVVEDLHWCDASSLDLIAALLEECPTLPLFILLSFRDEFEVPWDERAHMSRLKVDRLRRNQAEHLVARVALDKLMPAALLGEILDRADGVPLFLEELTKMVLEQSDASAGERGHGEPAELRIPATLQDSLMARLDRLGPAKEVAQLAATIGREFSYELLSQLDAIDADKLDEGLERLVSAELVYQRAPKPETRYRFKHALIQDMAYQSLLRGRRQAFHERIALVLEEKFSHLVRTQPELLARHFQEAGHPDRAIPFLQKAGALALGRCALVEAVLHLTRGIELLGALPETVERQQQELALQVPLGTAYLMSRGYGVPEVGAAYARARELSQGIAHAKDRAPVLMGLFRFYMGRGEYDTAREIGDELVELSGQTADDADRTVAHYARGSALHLLGEIPETLQEMQEAKRFYDPASHAALIARAGIDPGVTSAAVAAHALWELGHPGEAFREIREAMDLAAELDHVPSQIFAATWTAKLHLFAWEPEAVAARAQEIQEVCREHGIAFFLAISNVLHGWALAETGEAAAGTIELEEGMASLERQGSELFSTTWQTLYAQALAHGGRYDEAFSAIAKGLALVKRSRERYWEAELYRVEGDLVLMSQGARDADRAEARFRRALEIARELQMRSWELRSAVSLGELLAREGRQSEMRDLLAPLLAGFGEEDERRDLVEARTLLAAS